jgi:hypothetical protein
MRSAQEPIRCLMDEIHAEPNPDLGDQRLERFPDRPPAFSQAAFLVVCCRSATLA